MRLGLWADGDAVWYRQEHRGRYGFDTDVPAVFVRLSSTRATIRVRHATGGAEVLVSVSPERLRARDGDEATS